MKPSERRNPPRSVAQVLVVDDEPDIRELLELTAGQDGARVRSVGTIQDAKALLREGSFDLCLTDMRLVGRRGPRPGAPNRRRSARTFRWR